MKTTALTLLLSSGAVAFAPNSLSTPSASVSSSNKSALHVSVVRDIISKSARSQESSSSTTKEDKDLLDAFETQTPASVGLGETASSSSTGTSETAVADSAIAQPTKKMTNKKKRNKKDKKKQQRRKHNFGQLKHLKEEPDLDFYTLHSSAVSHLHKDMPVNDIVRAIKRAQNLHDVHDLRTISGFLVEHCDAHWGFGYRGSLLSRLAVAALHCDEVDLAMTAIQVRRTEEQESIQPHESAAIVRGLMRVGAVEEGWKVLEDELSIVATPPISDTQDLFKHRAKALASIASRYFYNGDPAMAAKAMDDLSELGSIIAKSELPVESLEVPWEKLVDAASKSNNPMDILLQDNEDLTQIVWDTMSTFPCPNEEEECDLEDFFSILP